MEPSSGKGKIYTWTFMPKSAHGPIAIGYVELDEGPTLLTRFIDTPAAALKVGVPVAVVFAPTEGTLPAIAFAVCTN